MSLKGTCHCGSVEVTIPRAPEKGTICNCSMCRRYGAIWGHLLPRDVQVHAKPGSLEGYEWGEKSIRFMRCANCGCVTHYDLLQSQGDDDTMCVNVRMFPPEAIGNIRIRRFDGADTWKYLED
ncbi:MAG TPA: GFA family protein [Ramlibacter sp.]|nr:GFA family protein [Ramlibacter sp.]